VNSSNPYDPRMRRTVVAPEPQRSNRHGIGAWLVVLVLAVPVLAACGDDDSASSTTSAPPAATTTTTEAPASAGPVTTATNATLGTILVDDTGRTLYVFDADQNGTSACGPGCTTTWPPLLLAAGASLPTSGPLSADLKTVTRSDGGAQIAYQNRPLYRFSGDTKAGDTNGDGVGNVWHVVKVS
jgi:predicted lipoprotein with Yx(FWY)xxD motif